ncbi:cytochrome c1 [Ferrovibrio sp.]|uniref:cytochrome c1 n=1 Tax=Ferrovibrio sp. TaxID=1917215 RepID=UPI0039C8B505
MSLRAILAALVLGCAVPAMAAEGSAPPAQKWSFDGPFGTFDRAALQRGYQIYKEVCSACHSMKYVAFRNLTEIGFSEAEAKALAAGYQVTDGPNDDGEMFQRPATLADKFPSPFPNDKAARAANGGALPPDLSLVAKARAHGPDYIYSVLTGYKEAPAGFQVPEGLHYNEGFPGHKIAMPQPLTADQVTYSDGTKATLEQEAHDVTTFLMWTAEPKLEERKRMGLKVMIFLVILTGLFFAAKKRIWRDVH